MRCNSTAISRSSFSELLHVFGDIVSRFYISYTTEQKVPSWQDWMKNNFGFPFREGHVFSENSIATWSTMSSSLPSLLMTTPSLPCVINTQTNASYWLWSSNDTWSSKSSNCRSVVFFSTLTRNPSPTKSSFTESTRWNYPTELLNARVNWIEFNVWRPVQCPRVLSQTTETEGSPTGVRTLKSSRLPLRYTASAKEQHKRE